MCHTGDFFIHGNDMLQVITMKYEVANFTLSLTLLQILQVFKDIIVITLRY